MSDSNEVVATGGVFLIGMEAVRDEKHRRHYLFLWTISLLLIPVFYSSLVTHAMSQWARGFHMKTVGYVFTAVVVGVLFRKHRERR